jgi:hypothetical protein
VPCSVTTLGVLGLFCGSAFAGEIWNEQTQGDLSDARLSPSAFTLASGGNTLVGVLEGFRETGEPDLDYFSITIPEGFLLNGITLDAYQSTDFVAFIGIVPGMTFPFDPASVNAEDLFGYALFGPFDVGGDLLAAMSQNGAGFTPPLPAGTYTFWAQQLGERTDYTATFQVAAVPSPGTLALLAVTAGACSRRRR